MKKIGKLIRNILLFYVIVSVSIVALFWYTNHHTTDVSSITPSFSSGRIAYISHGNVYVAQSKGYTKLLTTDGTDYFALTQNPIQYATPRWSPDGETLAIVKDINYGEASSLLLSDGMAIHDTKQPLYTRLPIFWFENNKLLLALNVSEFDTHDNQMITVTTKGTKILSTNQPGDPYAQEFDVPNGCGGGGRPAWSGVLSYNHLGGMDGIRATMLLSPKNEIIYSTGCEMELVEKLTNGSSKPFDKSQVNEEGIAWTQRSLPHELVLSPNKDLYVGTLKQNVALYDLQGEKIKELTSEQSAFGPVFSRDGKTIYFANHVGSMVTLESVAIDGTQRKILYTSPNIGAISNISLSPDDSQLIFTLITQTKPQDPQADDYTGKAKESIYLMNLSDKKITLFMDNAGQADWGI